MSPLSPFWCNSEVGAVIKAVSQQMPFMTRGKQLGFADFVDPIS